MINNDDDYTTTTTTTSDTVDDDDDNQGAKKIIFTACHSGKLKLAFTSPDVISTSPKNLWLAKLISQFLMLFKSLKSHHLPVGQVNNRIH